MTKQFDEFGLSPEMLSAIKDMGFIEPSAIQSEAILPVLQGRDIIGQAHTGSGKTAAYAIPAIEKINTDNFSVQLLILCPTRELVQQVENEIRKLTKYKKEIKFCAVFGGQQIEKQLKSLKQGVQIVIGTPGRLMDHMRRGSIDLSELKTVVLDEADEMLDMGFREDIAHILKDSPSERQTVMFSATMEEEILNLTKKFQTNPLIVNVITEEHKKPEIEQLYYEVIGKNKPELLKRLLDYNNVELGLVFCNTKSMVDTLVEELKSCGYFADGLHGDMNQNQREKVMYKFRKGSTNLLVATDVAGRGIDVSCVEAVFNYDLPRDDEDYIHRIGRTGRAGQKGKAFTFVSSKQVQHIKRIEKLNGQRILKSEAPALDVIEETKLKNHLEHVKSLVDSDIVSSYKSIIDNMVKNGMEPVDISASLLKILMEKETSSFDDSVDFNEQEIFEENKKKRERNRSRNRNHERVFSRVDKRIVELTSKDSKTAKKFGSVSKIKSKNRSKSKRIKKNVTTN